MLALTLRTFKRNNEEPRQTRFVQEDRGDRVVIGADDIKGQKSSGNIRLELLSVDNANDGVMVKIWHPSDGEKNVRLFCKEEITLDVSNNKKVKIRLLSTERGQAVLGFDAPKEIAINREELFHEKNKGRNNDPNPMKR